MKTVSQEPIITLSEEYVMKALNNLKNITKICEYCVKSACNVITFRLYSWYSKKHKTEGKIMKYVVMVSHGEFAPGLHSAVKMMTGDREDVLSTSLKSDMSADEFAANFEELVKDFTTDDQVILLADILSGSPFTNALNVLDQKGMLPNTLIIAGMNMPLAITAVLMKDNFDNVQDLKDTLLSEGRSGLTDFVVASDDEDEDL